MAEKDNREKVGVLNVKIEYKVLRNNREMAFELVDHGKIALVAHSIESLIGLVKDALSEVDMLDAAKVTAEVKHPNGPKTYS